MRKILTYFKVLTTASILSGIIFSPAVLFAASLYFEPQELNVAPGEEFPVTVYLDSPEGVNALGAVLTFPSDLRVVRLVHGNSIVDMWVRSPKEAAPGEIRFAGIVPGGFYGVRGEVFTVVFTGSREREGVLSLDDIEMYLNTPDAVSADVVASDLAVNVTHDVSGSQYQGVQDTEPPEPFDIVVLTDRSLQDGKNLLVFRAVDKGSGVAGYYIAKSHRKVDDLSMLEWEEAESPYPLETERGYVYVKAVDQFGNERVAMVSLSSALYPQKMFMYYGFWAILVVIAGVLALRLLRRVRKRSVVLEHHNVE